MNNFTTLDKQKQNFIIFCSVEYPTKEKLSAWMKDPGKKSTVYNYINYPFLLSVCATFSNSCQNHQQRNDFQDHGILCKNMDE